MKTRLNRPKDRRHRRLSRADVATM
jgi:hypothetical protein